jgi:hypothetical protein
MNDRPVVRPVPPPARASARKGTEPDDGTDNGTSPETGLTQADLRAYHLRRVTSKFNTTISPENVRRLAFLLAPDDDDRDTRLGATVKGPPPYGGPFTLFCELERVLLDFDPSVIEGAGPAFAFVYLDCREQETYDCVQALNITRLFPGFP